jgi:eukaryotic-like serine/threonine-protein kinase
MVDALIGTLFAGRFRIESVLGVGGMGTVYLAQHEVLRRQVALKVIRTDLEHEEELAPRFRREARAASRVDNPHVTYILDFGEAPGGRAYLAMEYVEGLSLDRVLARDGAFEVPRALDLLKQIAEALAAAHACNVIHRDLKPNNIVLTTHEGQPDFVKILDFGLAKILDLTTTSVVTPLGHTYGTPEYISPEQAVDHPLDARADIYGFGVLAFELLVGEVPFTGNTTQVVTAHVRKPAPAPSSSSQRGDIPKALDAVVLRCLAKDPAQRYQRAGALLEVLNSIEV